MRSIDPEANDRVGDKRVGSGSIVELCFVRPLFLVVGSGANIHMFLRFLGSFKFMLLIGSIRLF